MTVWRLITKEIAYRKLNFALAVLAVAVAVGCLVGELALLAAHETRAEKLGENAEAAARQRVLRLEDDYRAITVKLGYNLLILPGDQDLAEFHLLGYTTKTMPEEYAQRLASANAITVQHLLPTLQQKVEWPEKKVSILLMGTRGETPPAHRDPKKPIRDAVPPGEMIVGRVLADELHLAVGNEAPLMGKTFKVCEIRPPAGNEDDVTVWLNLAEAQQLLGRPGRVSAILALSCFCAEATPEGIRREVTRVLPDTQIVELAPQAAARRATRARAAEHGAETIAAEEAVRAAGRAERQAFAEWVVPLVIVACTLWVGVLAFLNVRERRDEIGILRALGTSARKIFTIFLAKSIMAGLAGAAVGYAAGLALGQAWMRWESGGAAGAPSAPLFDATILAAVLLVAPLLSAMAGLLPALTAAQQDPAAILREE